MMRAQNLRHAATGIIVRDSYGRIYVHRRTPTKDVYPAHWDFTAGGVVLVRRGPARGRAARARRGARRHQRARVARRGRLQRRPHDVPRLPLRHDVGRPDHPAARGGRVRRLAEPRAAARPDRGPGRPVHARRPRALRGLAARACGRPRRAARGLGHRRDRGRGPVAGPRAALPRRRGAAAQRDPADAAARAAAAAARSPVPIVLDESPLRVRHRLLPGELATRGGR